MDKGGLADLARGAPVGVPLGVVLQVHTQSHGLAWLDQGLVQDQAGHHVVGLAVQVVDWAHGRGLGEPDPLHLGWGLDPGRVYGVSTCSLSHAGHDQQEYGEECSEGSGHVGLHWGTQGESAKNALGVEVMQKRGRSEVAA